MEWRVRAEQYSKLKLHFEVQGENLIYWMKFRDDSQHEQVQLELCIWISDYMYIPIRQDHYLRFGLAKGHGPIWIFNSKTQAQDYPKWTIKNYKVKTL